MHLKKNNSIDDIFCCSCNEELVQELEKTTFFEKTALTCFLINDAKRTAQQKSARQVVMSLLWQENSSFKFNSIFTTLPTEIRYRIACERIKADCPWLTEEDAVLLIDKAIKDKNINLVSIRERLDYIMFNSDLKFIKNYCLQMMSL